MTKRNLGITLLAISALFIAGVVVAQGAYQLVTVRQIFKAGINLGASGTQLDDSYAATAAFDFPEMSNSCAESHPRTVTGAAMGDVCTLGPLDTRLGTGTNGSFSCYVSAANTIRLRFCTAQYDGGTIDLPDAGFSVRVIDP